MCVVGGGGGGGGTQRGDVLDRRCGPNSRNIPDPNQLGSTGQKRAG